MSIDKTVKRLALSIGVPVVVTVGAWTGINFYAHHNVNYEVDDKKVFQKADGIFAYTQLEINKDGSVEIGRYSFGNNRFYTDRDGDGDGNVDRIFQGSNPLARGSHSRSFERDKHLKQYPTVFQDADRDFRQQIQRFKPYINR